MPLAVFCCDRGGIIRQYNARATEMLGVKPALKHSPAPYRLYDQHGALLPADEIPVNRVLRTGQPVRDMHFILERADGARMTVIVSSEPFFDEHGQFTGVVNYFQPVNGTPLLPAIPASLESAHMAAIVSSSSDAIISKTLNGIILTWNAGATGIFGYQPSEMIGQPITRIIPPERLHEEENILQRIRHGERVEHFETERIAKDGRRIAISLTVSPVCDQSGRVIGASKIARDISERRNAEDVRHRLIQELNHRVKNTLATVQSLANQTASLARSPAAFSASFSERLQALAQTHDLLTQNLWHGADLMTILRERALFRLDDEKRMHFSGPRVTLEPQPALHMALVLHELSANARQYGALSVPDGSLSVSWIIHSGSVPKIILKWEEQGGPQVTKPISKGLGTALIKRALTTHDGHAALTYEPTGVVCEIELPLSIEASPLSPWNTDTHRGTAREME